MWKVANVTLIETSVYPDMWKVANVTLIETSVYPDTWKVANVTPIETSVYPDMWKVANVTPIETSVYPDMWKVANVTAIYKKDDKILVKSYRPISLLPICGKMFEKLIFIHLYSYLNSNNLLTKNQSGFRPGDSTINQLLFLVKEIHEAFDNPKYLDVRALFLDIAKAFDKVWYEGLIFKLKQNGISGNLLKHFESYLHNRKILLVPILNIL